MVGYNFQKIISANRYIKYCSGYKYQLRETAYFPTAIFPEKCIIAPLVILGTDGVLTIKRYFAWDGPSGPTIDTKSTMRASLVHDALYYLIRAGLLDESYKGRADAELEKYMVRDGACSWRACYYRWAVEAFGGWWGLKGEREVHIAP